MFKVDTPVYPPGYCALSGRNEDAEGFVDFGTELSPDAHVYISVASAKQLGRFVGMVDPEDHAQALAELAEVKANLAHAEEEIAEAIRFQESVEYTLKGVNKIRTKPGPRKVAA